MQAYFKNCYVHLDSHFVYTINELCTLPLEHILTTISVSLSWLWEAKDTHNTGEPLLLFHVLQTTIAAVQAAFL